MRGVAVVIGFLLVFSGSGAASGDSSAHSCTIFTVSMGERVFFGSNEDYTNPDTYYWAVPSRDDQYGGVYFGFDNLWPQGGVNEMGLAFDINALAETPLNPRPELPPLDDYEGYIVLSRCATVEEAIEEVGNYDWGEAMWGQIHFADATGDAVVVSAGEDGELAFSRKVEGGGFLVSTNFNLAFHDREERGGLCSRYDRAVQMLEQIESEDDLGVECCTRILDAVHAEGGSVNTLYSNVYDLGNEEIYVYYFHQFDEVARISVAQEIARGYDPRPIRELFPAETVERAKEEYKGYQSRRLGIYLTVLLLSVLVLALLLAIRRR